ncbi:MAG: DUF885 domain-containing protein [Gemmatimonadaceae bacterium]|nr:DUF885 domain-containing protein [Gemmatimonadaceae bacterium]
MPTRQRFATILLLTNFTVALPMSGQQEGAPAVQDLLAAVGQCSTTASFERSIAAGTTVAHLPQVSRGAWSDESACWRALASRAARIPATGLSAEEQLTVSVVRWEAGLQQDRADHWWVDFSSITPYASPLGYLARTIASFPIRSAADTIVPLQLLREVPALIDSIRAGLEQRAARGIRLSKAALPASVMLLRGFAAPADANPFSIAPSRATALDGATRTAFLASGARIVSDGIVPSMDRLVTLLAGDYSVQAPDRVGLSQYPGGAAYYAWLVRWHTTLGTTPEAVHAIGLAEVARIEREMAAIRAHVGFRGTRARFHAQLAKDPRFFASTPDEVGARLMLYANRLDPLLDRAFSTRPRARGDVRRLPAALEPSMTFGYYQEPTVADSMGHYLYNGTKLSERTLLTAAPLIAHELWPGHHFQIGLMRENTELPAYRKGYYTAYGEGWGDYASIVAGELGLYADPMDHYGRLAMDMFLSCRLVVDTGMNALGWSRERAMAYMRDHVLESDTQIASESLRYSTDIPGQALAYKMGSNEFVRLRTRAQMALGSRYDVRDYHDQVLRSGMLPMTVLGDKIDAWIAAGR